MSRLGPPYHIVSGNVSENARNQMSVKQHVLNEMLLSFLCFHSFIVDQTRLEISHLHPSAHGQAIIFLTRLLEVFFLLKYQFWQQCRTPLSIIKPSIWSRDGKLKSQVESESEKRCNRSTKKKKKVASSCALSPKLLGISGL